MDWLVYASMPFVAAAIGYVTKRVAIEMMFRPVRFVGVGFIGWQGVVPRNAPRMAAVAMDLMTTTLLTPRDVLRGLDPRRVADELREPIAEMADEITRDLLTRYQPGLWAALPERVRLRIVARVAADAPAVVERLVRELTDRVDEVLDVKDMAVRALVRDRAVLNRLIRDTARPEMRFIAHSGIWFGFLLGLVQLVVWALTEDPWVLPLFGGVTGWLTDWLALKMIFFPRAPRRFLGLVTWQGLFQRRRDEVARDYGTLIAGEVLTVDNVVRELLTGPRSDRLRAMVRREVQRAIDARAGLAKPFVVAAVGAGRYQDLKREAVDQAIDRIPATVAKVGPYALGALDIRETIVRQIRLLSPVRYEGLLRPAFRQDEWKLIAVGAAIGFLVGELQVLLLLH